MSQPENDMETRVTAKNFQAGKPVNKPRPRNSTNKPPFILSVAG